MNVTPVTSPIVELWKDKRRGVTTVEDVGGPGQGVLFV